MVKLNKEQIKAVKTIKGNLLILASAGTGKTTTIVERYASMITNHRYKPSEVLMTTFTNKAAKDMIEKIKKRIIKVPHYIGTMHSIFLRMLRTHSNLVLPHENFTIIDDPDKKKIIKNILAEKGIDTKADNVKYFLREIGKFKNRGISAAYLDSSLSFEGPDKPDEIIADDNILIVNKKLKKIVPEIYKRYEGSLRKRNIIDLDDILLLAFQILEEHKGIRKQYSKQFKAIMVDEAQDLNFVQMKILNLLQNNNLCLIGDDCQNIYEWRGSSNDLVFKFNKHFKTIKLKDNYRSTGKIINAVNKAIESMKFKIDKELACTRKEGKKIAVEAFDSFDEETYFIVTEVKRLIKNKTRMGEIAVLFRTNNIGKRIEREFRKNNIPCHLSRAKGFFERVEIKDVLSFLKLKANPMSMIDFERAVLLLEGFGKTKVKKIEELADLHKCTIVQALDYAPELKFNEKLKQKLALLKGLLKDTKTNPISAFMAFTKYEENIAKKYWNDKSKIEDKTENIKVLSELFKGHKYTGKGIKEFLDGLIEIGKKEKSKNKVMLSTIHGAKGLEWKYVLLACCNDGVLPFYRGELTNAMRDSELRLFYVAISRAKDFLTITYPEFNGWQEVYPSEFLDIIE